ncbi:hypothetical protein CAI21_10200 [Alkalilimnicola ehrlichii]|uniref:DUF456 domain-containing protein n=1 Tax=Alkalilimnicola ehrlichii TaxID=351052 RepID=A0A3E0WIJ2_9GAMM|nr:DUF456 domain-containing protein [Alkalilimnicola ehrlichii]RFA29420.1 hypothetical protein CAI21_10200 [Alkalilimnicola ehrlichii]RFA31937.1 hypothetical protein CAL65_21045 [Alkalilimnicola ehrlichii]
MTTVLIWLGAILLIAVGLAGLILPALPGPLLLFAGLWMAAWAEGFAFVGMKTLIILGILAALASLADFVAGAFGAKRYGASPRSVWGAALGALVGLFFGLPGLLLGPFVGAVLGELSARWDLAAAGRAGWGATIGLVLGTAAKVAFGLTMVLVFLAVRLL